MNNSTLIHGATVLVSDENEYILKAADVVIKGNRIIHVGKTGEFRGAINRKIDGSGKLLCPGFVNAHGHAAMTLLRSIADDMPLMQWLENHIWPVENNLTGEDVYWGTMLAIAEMIRGGTTTFADMYFFMEYAAKAADESGIRAVLSRGLIGVGPKAEQGLAEAEELVRNWNGKCGGRITTMLGPHAPYTCPPSYMKKILQLQEKLNVPLQVHLAETEEEETIIKAEHNSSPTALLKNIGVLERPVTAAHCVHLDGDDISILHEHEVRVVHNPGSNLKLGSGISPVPDMLSKGMTVGLGTDGAASNNNLDMLEETRLAALLHKGVRKDPTCITAPEAMQMATSMGAQALFLEDVGEIAPGMKADLMMVDMSGAHLTPAHNLLSHLVYSARSSDIDLVMADGKVLLQGGELTTIDEEKIKFNAGKRAAALLKLI